MNYKNVRDMHAHKILFNYILYCRMRAKSPRWHYFLAENLAGNGALTKVSRSKLIKSDLTLALTRSTKTTISGRPMSVVCLFLTVKLIYLLQY